MSSGHGGGHDDGPTVDSIVAELDAEEIFQKRVKKSLEASNEALGKKYAKIGEKVKDKDLEDKADEVFSDVIASSWNVGKGNEEHMSYMGKMILQQFATDETKEKFYAAVKNNNRSAAKTYFQEAITAYLVNQSKEKTFRKAEKLEGEDRMNLYKESMHRVGGDDLTKVAGKQESRNVMGYLSDLEARAKKFKKESGGHSNYSHN